MHSENIKEVTGNEPVYGPSTINDDIVPYIIENRTGVQDAEEDPLTDEQLKKLEEAIQQADEGKVMNLEEFKKKMASWHIK